MGWNKTSHEGRVCYERNDGTRLFCTEDIDRLETAERMVAAERDHNMKIRRRRAEDDIIIREYSQEEETTTLDRIITVIALVIVITLAIFSLMD